MPDKPNIKLSSEQMHEEFREVVNEVFYEYGVPYHYRSEPTALLSVHIHVNDFIDKISCCVDNWRVDKTLYGTFYPFLVKSKDLETVVNELRLRLILIGHNVKDPELETIETKSNGDIRVAIHFTDSK